MSSIVAGGIDFGSIISNERKKRRYRLREVASQIRKEDGRPISLQFLDNLEKGLRRPSPHLVPQFAQLFEVSEELLFASLGLVPPDMLRNIQSREQVLKGLQAFREVLAHPPEPKPRFHKTYTVDRPQHPESPHEDDTVLDPRTRQGLWPDAPAASTRRSPGVRERDTVAGAGMDRLVRDLDDLPRLVRRLTSQGVRVQFLKEFLKELLAFIGEDSPMAHLLLSVIGAFAEFERALTHECQQDGIAVGKGRGAHRGRKPSLSASQVLTLRQRAQAGERKTKLAREFGISRETLNKYLKRPL